MFAGKFGACGFAQSEKAIDAASNKHVIPAGDVQARNTNFFEAPANVERGPVFAWRIMIEPVEDIRRQTFAVKGGYCANRKNVRLRSQLRPSLFKPIACFPQLLPSCVHLQQLQTPTQRGREAQRSPLIEPAVIQVACRHPRRDTNQALGLFGRSEKLRHALVRESIHRHAAVGFGSRAQPCDRIGAVGPFVAKRVEVAFGITAATHVLYDDVVSPARKPNGMGVYDGRCNVASIRLAHQECRLRTGLRRVVVFGNQLHTIAHARAHATFEADASAAIDPRARAHGVGGSG